MRAKLRRKPYRTGVEQAIRYAVDVSYLRLRNSIHCLCEHVDLCYNHFKRFLKKYILIFLLRDLEIILLTN